MRHLHIPAAAPCILLALVCACGRHSIGDEQSPQFQRIHELEAGEGVFAYSRISPDGERLVYAAEDPDGRALHRVIKLLDLGTRELLFTEFGIDAYFSPEGDRMIYLSYANSYPSVSIRDNKSGSIFRDIAPDALGDYFSWATRDGEDLILTINSNYYRLENNRGIMPNFRVPACPGIGVGERPLISKDAERITTFVGGTVVVRGLDNCDNIIRTGIAGAKADFSYDGTHLAMHAPRSDGKGYDVMVVSLTDRTVRNVTSSLPGSSYFPSWTRDGRLSFRYDGDDFRGFMMASEVMNATARPLPTVTAANVSTPFSWSQVFPGTPAPDERVAVVMAWAPWSAHAPYALKDMEEAKRSFSTAGMNVAVYTAADPGSRASDVSDMRERHNISLEQIPLLPANLIRTGLHNQNPSNMLFVDGQLKQKRLGPLKRREILEWVRENSKSAGAR